MLQIMGILLLFLGDKLLHCGVRRCCSSTGLATAWAGRSDHGCLDVWNFREYAVRHRVAADRKRGPVVGGNPKKGRLKGQPIRLGPLYSPCIRQYSFSFLPELRLYVSQRINLRLPIRTARVSAATTANANQSKA
jgi:hypothetical protein